MLYNMSLYKIILIDFQFSDSPKQKLRPALILSKRDIHEDVIAAAISSKINKARQTGDVFISSNDDDFKLTGLKASSIIRLNKLTTVNSKRISGELGVLPHSYETAIKRQLREIFSI